MKLLLFVHTDPRKTNRSATVRVQKGDYLIESNAKDSEVEIVLEGGQICDVCGSACDGAKVTLGSPTNLYLVIKKAGTEPHLTIYLRAA